MTGEINLKHSEMFVETACSNMQLSILFAEAGTSNFIVDVAQVLEIAYNAQQSGDKDIYSPHSGSHQFTITIAKTIQESNGSYGIVPTKIYLADPGLPTANMTGTKVGEYEDETNQTAKVFNTWMQSWQQAAEQEAMQGYTQLSSLSQGANSFVQFASETGQVGQYLTQLIEQIIN
ncbi:MAG: hypothetical protein KDK64_01925 [Chlamydiia bacterium]|nr:hypothetical protein [Chlamydiia bacterium]